MSHTKGLLHIIAPDDDLWARGISDETRTCVAFCGRDAPELARADARRLVACWNACRHLTTEQLEAGDLDYAGCSTLADIREALEVGDKPMLNELGAIIRTRMGVIKILEREAAAHAAEIERLTADRDTAVRERDAAVEALERLARDVECGCQPCTGGCRSEEALAIEYEERLEFARAALAKIEGGRNGQNV